MAHRGIMDHVERIAARQRLDIEAHLSLGLPNTPLHGVELTAVSGNLVTAKPLGVRGGIDFDHSGEVRRVRSQAIESLLAGGNLVILPPLGYSRTGEVFDLDAADIAQHVAVALKADKLILLGESAGLHDDDGRLQRQLGPAQGENLRQQADPGSELWRHLGAACEAARHGVARTHLLSWHDHDALLGELFTRDGVGTMITQNRYEQLRQAVLDDVGGLLALLKPLEARGMLVARTRERLEHEIDDYVVIERDGMIIGCAALHRFPDAAMGELACLAVHTDYRRGSRGDTLLSEVERRARRHGFTQLFALTTHTTHWFFRAWLRTLHHRVAAEPEARGLQPGATLQGAVEGAIDAVGVAADVLAVAIGRRLSRWKETPFSPGFGRGCLFFETLYPIDKIDFYGNLQKSVGDRRRFSMLPGVVFAACRFQFAS